MDSEMILILIFVCILILMVLLVAAHLLIRSNRRGRTSSETIWTDQSTLNLNPPAHQDLPNIGAHTSPDYTDSITFTGNASGNLAFDSTSVDSTVTTDISWDSPGSTDSSSEGDFGGFGGGGDFSGGGAGGDWSSN